MSVMRPKIENGTAKIKSGFLGEKRVRICYLLSARTERSSHVGMSLEDIGFHVPNARRGDLYELEKSDLQRCHPALVRYLPESNSYVWIGPKLPRDPESDAKCRLR